jgi:N-acetyl-1-D-myo-inositol-2-amino-2-deoxy-alpha-D-glucopyranoside deacetylase
MTTTPQGPEGAGDEPGPGGLTQEQRVLDEAAEVVEQLEPEMEMDVLDNRRRLLLVHAHPDDETIATGVTMARYASEGVHVTLVTCTLGEEGEILVPGLSHLGPDGEDTLGEHRREELAAAMEALGVHDYRFLGAPGRYRDSGMMGEASNDRPQCFWQADLDEAAAHLASVVREVRPQVVVTYDENGGYGHPDHIQAHRVTMRAVAQAADRSYRPELGEPWDVLKLYWTAVPRSVVQAGIEALAAAGHPDFFGVDSADDVPFAVDDALVTSAVEGGPHVEAKSAAMRAHATQIEVDGPFFALSDKVGQTILTTEFFRLVLGERGPVDGTSGLETDLFAGLD